MAESISVKSEKESFRCPICLERLNIPRYLPCLHTFCEVCIQTYISSSTTPDEKDDVNVFECPVCRQRVQEPQKGISSDAWAKCFPLNKWAWSMSYNSEKDSMKHCMFCKREELTVLAKHWCKSCAEPLCNDCKRFHKRVPILQNHKIVDLNDEENLKEDIDMDENCSIHKEKTLDFFCQDHNKLCCSACFALQHKRCANFDTVDEIVKNISKDEMKDKLISLSNLVDCISKLRDENKRQYNTLCTQKEDICSLFAKNIEEVKMFLDQAHEQWLKRFDVEHTHNTDNIEVVSDELKRFNTTVTEAKSMLSSVLENGSDRQIFVVQSQLHTQILDHFDRLKTLKIWELTDSYSFEPNQLKSLTETMKFENITQSKGSRDVLNRISVCGKSLMGEGLPSPKPCLANVVLMSATLKIVSACQNEIFAYFGLFIDNNRVVFSNETKQSLDVYDTSSKTSKLVCTLNCDSIPYDMCYAYSMNRIYVAFGGFVVQYEIKNLGTQFVETERITVENTVIGIAKITDGFFTANESSASFRWSDFSIRSDIPYVKSRERPFICSSFCGKKVAYTTENSFIVMDTKGNKLSEYFCSPSNPIGLSFDSGDNIIVCLNNREIKQIRYNGTSSRCIKKNDNIFSRPENIVFHPEGHMFMNFDNGTYFDALKTWFPATMCVFEVLTK
ncbi:uncharacterized protein LOC128160887 [Crassostrea angulata]|uniref:uncharacterized protein LOC128160887 n=1 Tax=Magallana angulata TaxID=2784310 RepID=UPI0022B09979|nr:uncharacterized protein LOC128160887 [Crassostrea angulata]